MQYLRLMTFISLSFFHFTVSAQKQKSTLPKISTLLGQYRDTIKLNREAVIAVIGLPLRIVDDKRVVYSIASYQIAYRRKAFVSDEQTGKVQTTFSLAAERFISTPLNEIWIKSIQSQVQSGEEIIFYDIIVKDPKGMIMFAPNFKIIVI